MVNKEENKTPKLRYRLVIIITLQCNNTGAAEVKQALTAVTNLHTSELSPGQPSEQTICCERVLRHFMTASAYC